MPPHCLFLAPLLKWPLREIPIFHLRLGIASVFVWKSTKVGADALLGGGKQDKHESGIAPTPHLYFSRLVEPKNAGIIFPVRKRFVLQDFDREP